MVQFLFCQRALPGGRKPINKRISVARCLSRQCRDLFQNNGAPECRFNLEKRGPRNDPTTIDANR